jgi:hypothetical protein
VQKEVLLKSDTSKAI